MWRVEVQYASNDGTIATWQSELTKRPSIQIWDSGRASVKSDSMNMFFRRVDWIHLEWKKDNE